jgi:hypothetical protein
MTLFSPETPKNEVLGYLDSTSCAIIRALKAALIETKRSLHSLGTPIDVSKGYDKSIFSHLMRYVAKRALNDIGLQARIEEDNEVEYQLGQAANTGIILQLPGIYARVIKSPLLEDLPPAGSWSRAKFYEQRQYSIPFPLIESEAAEVKYDEREAEIEKALHLVYAWDIGLDLETIGLKLVCPNERSGKHRWQHFFPEAQMKNAEETNVGQDLAIIPASKTPIAIAAAAANTDLDLSPRAEVEITEQVKPDAAKRA